MIPGDVVGDTEEQRDANCRESRADIFHVIQPWQLSRFST